MKYKKKYTKWSFWEIKENAINESKKYSSRTEFSKMSFGAYTISKRNGWLDEMVWLNNKNVYKDPVDSVYVYHFSEKNSVYVGRTIYPKRRDKQHRTKNYDTVYKFSKDNNIDIPEMEIIESGLTVVEGANRERYWAEHYKNNGFILLNKQPCGSLGYMSKGKWSKKKCFEEAKKYKTRSEFRRIKASAYSTALKNRWLDEMDWMPMNNTKPKGYWKNKENFINEAKKYKSKKELMDNNFSAYMAGHRYNYIDDIDWPNGAPKSRPYNYWKDKEHTMEESKKYNSKIEFQTKNQSAYWAALKYGYLEEMTWLVKNKVTPKGFYKNKEFIMNEGRKYKTRGEFEKMNKSAYSAALRYGWLNEMDWLTKKEFKPKGYWDDINNIIKEAKKYKTKNELRKNNGYLYKLISKRKCFNEVNWLNWNEKHRT